MNPTERIPSPDETIPYQHPRIHTTRTWRTDLEHAINRYFDIYDTILDFLPPIAGVILLIWLTTWVPHR